MSEQKGKWLRVKSPADLRPGDRVRYWDADGLIVGERSLRKVNDTGDKIVSGDGRTVWWDIKEFFELWSHVEVWKEDDFVFEPDKEGEDPLEPKNGQRAEWAEKALRAFLKATKESFHITEDEVCDLMTDLLHLCDREGVDAQLVADRSVRNWRAER